MFVIATVQVPDRAEQFDCANDSRVTLPGVAHGHAGLKPAGCSEATICPDGVVELEATVAVQAQTIAELRAVNAAQAQAIAALEARVAELERRLGTDSSNSSKPPSSDGLRKPTRTTRRGGEQAEGRRAPGKQPGAPGAHLAQVAQPDEMVRHVPDRCDGCGAELADAVVEAVEARQVFDLPPLRLSVSEHRAERCRCGCGATTQAVFPVEARAAACYGPGVRALCCYLLAHQHLPVDRAAQLLADVLGAPVSTGTLAGLMAEGAAGLDGFVECVRDRLAAAPVAHFDETGARVAGRLHWVHSASTPSLSLFTVHPKRGKVAMDAAGVLPGFHGVAVHDGWSPYWRYQVTHALCGAHLLRELDAVTCEPGQGWAAGMAELLADAKTAADRALAAGAEQVSDGLRARLHARYQRLLADGQATNPPPQPRPRHRRRGRLRRSPAANLLDRLDRHRVEVLRFLDDVRVPFDNNQAERDLRMVKLQQKISGCWRTLDGAQAFLTVRSYVSTARKHEVNPLHALRQLFQGSPWLPGLAEA
jgi:transposase